MHSPIAPEPSSDLVWFEHLRRLHIDTAIGDVTAALEGMWSIRADCTWASHGVRMLGARLDELIDGLEDVHLQLHRQTWGGR